MKETTRLLQKLERPLQENITRVLKEYENEIIGWKDADEVLPSVVDIINYVKEALGPKRIYNFVKYVIGTFIKNRLSKEIAECMLENLNRIYYAQVDLVNNGYIEAEGIVQDDFFLGYLLIMLDTINKHPEFAKETVEAFGIIALTIYVGIMVYIKGIHRMGDKRTNVTFAPYC